MEPFKVSDLIEEKSLGKIFKSHQKENTIIEIGNYLSGVDIEEATDEEINKIISKNNLKPNNLKKEFFDLFEYFVSFSMEKMGLDNIDFSDFKKFAVILNVNLDELNDTIYERSKDRFRSEVEKLIDQEPDFEINQNRLDFLQNKLRINDLDFNQIIDEIRLRVAKNAFDETLNDGQYSPEEEESLNNLYKKLKIVPQYNEKTMEILEKERILWKIKNDSLPIIQPGINLNKSELCHYSCYVDYFEYKTVTTKIGYSGPALRLKIMDGVYYKAGNYNFQRTTEDKLVKLDSGNVYITNKRLLFIGSNRTINIRINRILDVEFFKDGIEIIKDAGRNVFIKYTNELEILGGILIRAISDYNQ